MHIDNPQPYDSTLDLMYLFASLNEFEFRNTKLQIFRICAIYYITICTILNNIVKKNVRALKQKKINNTL